MLLIAVPVVFAGQATEASLCSGRDAVWGYETLRSESRKNILEIGIPLSGIFGNVSLFANSPLAWGGPYVPLSFNIGFSPCRPETAGFHEAAQRTNIATKRSKLPSSYVSRLDLDVNRNPYLTAKLDPRVVSVNGTLPYLPQEVTMRLGLIDGPTTEKNIRLDPANFEIRTPSPDLSEISKRDGQLKVDTYSSGPGADVHVLCALTDNNIHIRAINVVLEKHATYAPDRDVDVLSMTFSSAVSWFRLSSVLVFVREAIDRADSANLRISCSATNGKTLNHKAKVIIPAIVGEF